jgi:hypothetical protein
MKTDLNEKLENIYNQSKSFDIREHLYTLKRYASLSNHVTEMGVRGVVSTWALLAGKPKVLRSYDITHPREFQAANELNDVINIANEHYIDYRFIQKNVLEANIAPTDLLFIDTWHVYKQMKAELKLHSPKVRKWIIMHDTSSCEFVDEVGYEKHLGWDNPRPEGFPRGKGIWPAIEEFLKVNEQNWRIKERFYNCQGLTVLERVSNKKTY